MKPNLIKTLRNHTPGNITQWTCTQIMDAMEDYGNQMYNSALDWAANNAHVIYDKDENPNEGVTHFVDKESILKGKL